MKWSDSHLSNWLVTGICMRTIWCCFASQHAVITNWLKQLYLYLMLVLACAADCWCVVLLDLLYLSAVFDALDLGILLCWLLIRQQCSKWGHWWISRNSFISRPWNALLDLQRIWLYYLALYKSTYNNTWWALRTYSEWVGETQNFSSRPALLYLSDSHVRALVRLKVLFI